MPPHGEAVVVAAGPREVDVFDRMLEEKTDVTDGDVMVELELAAEGLGAILRSQG